MPPSSPWSAHYEADRADRAFTQVEPESRLVARSLEARWEAKLAALAQAEQHLADLIAAQPALPEPERLKAPANDLPQLWPAPTTSAKDRKRLLRTLIADVTVRHVDFADAHIGVRWHTGADDEIVCARRTNRTPSQAVAVIRDLLDTRTDTEIADHLNQLGLKTGNARPFTVASIRFIRAKYVIGSVRSDPTEPDEITVPEVARRLGIHEATVCQRVQSRPGPGVSTSWGSKLFSTSRGTAVSTGPTSVSTVLEWVPLRLFPSSRPARSCFS